MQITLSKRQLPWRFVAVACVFFLTYGRTEALDNEVLFRENLSDQEISRVFIESDTDEVKEKLALMAMSGEYNKIPITTLRVLCFESAINDVKGHVPFAQKLVFLDKLCEVVEVYFPLGRAVLSRKFGERYCRELADLEPQEKITLQHIDLKQLDTCVLEYRKTGRRAMEDITLSPDKDLRKEILDRKFPSKGTP